MPKLWKLLVLLALFALPVYGLGGTPFNNDPGDTGDGSGTCVTTCARQCRDGSWSSIACNSNERATCDCTGISHGSSVQAFPSCSTC
ncbi:MAG TPA: hypothetical protein VGE98_13460 [Thermoanaerobaculia bacterium]